MLEPQGKVSAWGRVTRVADDEIIFDVDPGFADVTLARLMRFKLRTKADIERLDWRLVTIRGDGAIIGEFGIDAIDAERQWSRPSIGQASRVSISSVPTSRRRPASWSAIAPITNAAVSRRAYP